MTTRRTPPSASERTAQVDVRGWVGGIRLSGFMVIMLSLVVLGAWVLVPTLGTYLDQKQKISALEHSVQVTQQKIDDLKAERARWNDPAYITAQARERLFYVKPGEVVYLIDNDIAAAAQPKDQAPVSDKPQERSSDWAAQLLRSVTGAGLAQTATGAAH
ncbi:septum formation initiator family protein [Microbacterium panaciterrae]|uniref:Septum formation initiator family protein n=1 Tax=Microbacterium panaciterrae TaxID=985759 RepID=A0ABP8PRN9_9MICO